MLKPPAQVVMLHARNSERALENLNRITGLCFSRWPVAGRRRKGLAGGERAAVAGGVRGPCGGQSGVALTGQWLGNRLFDGLHEELFDFHLDLQLRRAQTYLHLFDTLLHRQACDT